MKYTVCFNCGHKLLKADDGSNIEIQCPKCNEKLLINVSSGKIVVVAKVTALRGCSGYILK